MIMTMDERLIRIRLLDLGCIGDVIALERGLVRDGATVFFFSRGCRAEFLGELPTGGSSPAATCSPLVAQEAKLTARSPDGSAFDVNAARRDQ